MSKPLPVEPPRERIVDAAERVMRERGIAKATTRAIAEAAGYSEAMIYKHFNDKQQLFLAVLAERLPDVSAQAPVGGDLAARLTRIVEAHLGGFVHAFPMAASIFGEAKLLAEHREAIAKHGGGPAHAVDRVAAFLEGEQQAGTIAATADTGAASRVLVGTAFHQAFLAAYAGEEPVPGTQRIAEETVAVVLPYLRS